MQIDWLGYTLDGIIGGKNADGVRLLELFLNDYKAKFNVQSVNPSCSKCLKEYYQKLTQSKKSNLMESLFRLKAKYQNIPLRHTGEGYNVNVNNANLTDEKAIILLERYPVEKVFDIYPDAETIESLKEQFSTPVVEETETESEEVVTETTKETEETTQEVEATTETSSEIEVETEDNPIAPETTTTEAPKKRGLQPKNNLNQCV